MSYKNAPEIPEMMTVKFIQEYLDFINSISGDCETAHIAEDNIYYAVVHSIANEKCTDPILCCKEVMKVEEIQFDRWHA